MKVRWINWLLIVVLGNLVAFSSAASEFNIDKTIELYPERISRILDNPNAIELRNLSIAEKQLISIHAELTKWKIKSAADNLNRLDISNWQAHERSYYYYLSALLHIKRGESVQAIENLQRLKGFQWPSIIEQPAINYLLLYARAYLAANEYDLVTNTMVQLRSLMSQSSDELAICKQAMLEAEIVLSRERINDVGDSRQALKDRCSMPTDSVVYADSALLLTKLNFMEGIFDKATEELLQQAHDNYLVNNVNLRLTDTLILSGVMFTENSRVVDSIAVNNSLSTLVTEEMPHEQLSRYYDFLVKFYSLVGDERATYESLRLLGDLNTKIQKNNRTLNANFLSFRVVEQQQELLDSIKLQREEILDNTQSYNDFFIGLIFSLCALFLLAMVLFFIGRGKFDE